MVRSSSVNSTKNMELPTLETLTQQSMMKFLKNLSDLPIHVDFPRLFPLITMMDMNKNIIWEERKIPDNLVSNMLEFLVILDKYLNLGKEDEMRKRFYEYIPLNSDSTSSDIPNGLKKFFGEVLTDHSIIISILKCINQAIIVPAVTILRLTFMSAKINYFEIRGKWNVIIKLYDDKISVTNKRWERSAPESFNFCWDVEFIINKETKDLIDTKLYISELSYVNEVTDEEKSNLHHLLRELYIPIQ